MSRGKCVVPQCENLGEHFFPVDESLRLKWIKNLSLDKTLEQPQVNQRFWSLRKYSRICSQHFLPSDYNISSKQVTLKKTAVPSLIHGSSQQDVSSPIKKNKLNEHKVKLCSKTYARSALPIAYVEEHLMLNIETPSENDPLHISDDDMEMQETLITYTEEDACFTIQDMVNTETVIEDQDVMIEEQITSHSQLLSMYDKEVQTETFEPLKQDCSVQVTPKFRQFSVYNYINVDSAIHFYSGLESFEKLVFVFNTLGDSSKLKYFYDHDDSVMVLDSLDQFFLTLIILRRHKEYQELAFLFSISEKKVASIFITWVRFMSLQWQNLDLWVDRESVKSYMPIDFHDKYPMTRVIIDATECPIKKPTLPLAQQITFSSYKNRNTLKFLVGISPSGFISYLSPCYGGSATDRQIIEKSSILQKFDYNDEIMVDKGLNVQDIFMPYGVKVNMPSFFKKGNQISPDTLRRDRKIASKRVHVERLIGMMKTYKILKQTMNQTESTLSSDIVFIIAMLVNFRSSIVSKCA